MAGFLVLWMGTILPACQAAIYTNEWAIKIRGRLESVDRIAEKYGFTNAGQIGGLESYYSFRHRETANRSTVGNKGVTVGVAKETEVVWLQQQVVLRRARRSPSVTRAPSDDTGAERRRPPRHRSGRALPQRRGGPVLNSLWYIHCSDESYGCRSPMNIAGAWSRGYTGKGVVVSVVDDGVEREHPDLMPNYDPLASHNVKGQDRAPSPNPPDNAADFHGTQCAGTVAAAANSSRCTTGVAFHARVGGIRMLDGDMTDTVEARSLSFRPQYIDIYLAGWGPEDDGATLEGPGPLTRLVLRNGVHAGRRGRGSVFVWASGNGGRRGDHCSCDGYSSSVYTISISSSTRSGSPPDYLEQCASTLAAAHGGEEAPDVVTLGPRRSCSPARPGTSLSASVAAGVIALALEANPSLTWRDVQHIIVRTSKARHLVAPDWHVNGAGYRVSHLYGFGLLDAESVVKEAERWRAVPPQHECVEEVAIQPNGYHVHRVGYFENIRPGSALTSAHRTTGCAGEARGRVAYVEHVVVRVTVAHCRRGDLSITLTSPAGTMSQLLNNRPLDSSTEGFLNWEFMTAHCWGEQAAGEWTLKIQDTPSRKRDGCELGALKKWSLVIYGTAEKPYPEHHKRARSAGIPADGLLAEEYSGPCDPECSDDGCEGPGPQQCVTCLHFFLKFKNNTRLCVPECPRGFWGDRRRCKRCYSSCQSCSGSRSDQCTSCQPGHRLTEGANTCTASCGDSHYLDHDANVCRKCSDNCLKCTSYSICTECKPDTSLQGNRCQRSCAAGFYHDAQEGSCQPCHEACATCAGAGVESCKRCADGYLTEEWRCVASCSAGFYAAEPAPETADRHRMCRRCDASCLTCAGPSRGNCSSCSSGHSLQEGLCVVNTVCTDGEYQDGGGKCRPCDATCLKCTGPQSEDCISCAPSRALDEGRCVAACAKGKYRSGGRCHLCDHTCATCVDAGASNCTSCDTDKFGLERYLHRGHCVDACPEAFFHTAARSCEPCAEHCRLCAGPERCLACNSSHHLSDGHCVKQECGEGEVEDPDYQDCMACEEGCKKCVLYNPRHCLSCIEGFYNFQDGCYKYCPAKTYGLDSEKTCVPCDDNCVSCDEHECYWCESDLFLSEGRCVSECPDGYYGDEDTNNCEECHADCETCDGPEDSDCLSCEDGSQLEAGECVADHDVCPVGTFRGDDGACEDCHQSCESCSGEERNQCTSCAKGRFLTAQQTCVSKCPGGFFASRPSGLCEACLPGCLQCADAGRCSRCSGTRKAQLFLQDGRCVQECVRGYPAGQVCRSCAPGCASCAGNATHCLSCDGPLVLHQHRCAQECPPAHFAHGGACRRCPSACEECEPLGQCTACEDDHFLHEGLCVLDCPEGSFGDRELGACAPCHAKCATCDGPGAGECDACADPGAALHDGACLAACPPHTYRDAAAGRCRDCHASCLSCHGPHAGSCSSCREDQRLDGSGHCAPPAGRCSPRQYADRDGQCHPCHKYCHGCSGPGKTHCLSCNPRHLLLNGTCVDACPAGYYEAEDGGQRCEPCHASCQSCVGRRGSECLACKAHLFREGKECVEACQPSHYGNAATGTCERCDPSCAGCSGGGEDGCLGCAPGLVHLPREGRCLAACPAGSYEDAARGTCEPCHASCRTCSEQASDSCDSCFAGFQLSAGSCESMCDIGQYPDEKGTGHLCEDCHGSCLECRGPGPSNCTMCPAQAILEAGGRCLLCCRHEEEDAAKQQQDCCNCTESRGECILGTNLAFRNEGEEAEEQGNLTIFVIACVLLVLALVAVAFLVRHSRSKSRPSELPPRGYEKLTSGGGFGGGGGGSRYGGGGGGYTSSSSNASYSGRGSSAGGGFQETQLVDFGERRRGVRDEDEDDEDEDIVYMGQDGTVYRKFRYGQLGDDNDDELEYDDESYAFR